MNVGKNTARNTAIHIPKYIEEAKNLRNGIERESTKMQIPTS